MKQGWALSSVSRLFGWAQAHSLRYFPIHMGCCSDELLQAVGCRYDLERFGVLPEVDPIFSDLLIVSGAITTRSAPELRKIYDQMPHPKFVMAIGSCACSGGAFGPEATGSSTLAGLSGVVPVDIYVPGCPPRPEAILEGLLRLQEKIEGKKISPRKQGRKQGRIDRLETDEWDLR